MVMTTNKINEAVKEISYELIDLRCEFENFIDDHLSTLSEKPYYTEDAIKAYITQGFKNALDDFDYSDFH